MVERAVAALAEVTRDVVVISSMPVPDSPVPVIPDRIEGAGPLAGLEAALVEAGARGAEGVLLLACDLPLVHADLLRRIAGALAGVPAAAPERAGGGVEPLCAAWRCTLLAMVERNLRSDRRSLHALFEDAGGRVVRLEALGPGAEEAMLNVNTQADLLRAELALGKGAP
jgi:molybdopterin-guanine dinucleotide biosynthesis protein A